MRKEIDVKGSEEREGGKKEGKKWREMEGRKDVYLMIMLSLLINWNIKTLLKSRTRIGNNNELYFPTLKKASLCMCWKTNTTVLKPTYHIDHIHMGTHVLHCTAVSWFQKRASCWDIWWALASAHPKTDLFARVRKGQEWEIMRTRGSSDSC